MRYSVGWYTKPNGQVIVQITESLNAGWFADLYEAKFAAARFWGERPVLFRVERARQRQN